MLTVDQARVLLSSIPKDTVAGHRDRTLIALMIYSFARIGAALALDVGDLYRELHRLNIRLNEKGGKRHHMPCHHTLDAYLVQYMTLAGLGPAPDAPLFQTITRDRRALTGRRLNRTEAWYMVRRRARAAGIDTPVSCHTFRGTGITAYLEHPDAKLEEAQKMAAHSDPQDDPALRSPEPSCYNRCRRTDSHLDKTSQQQGKQMWKKSKARIQQHELYHRPGQKQKTKNLEPTRAQASLILSPPQTHRQIGGSVHQRTTRLSRGLQEGIAQATGHDPERQNKTFYPRRLMASNPQLPKP